MDLTLILFIIQLVIGGYVALATYIFKREVSRVDDIEKEMKSVITNYKDEFKTIRKEQSDMKLEIITKLTAIETILNYQKEK